MSDQKRHPGGIRGRGATGVHKYCAYLMPEQAEEIRRLQHRLRIDTWSEMLRILVEKGMHPKKWAGVEKLIAAERERCAKKAADHECDSAGYCPCAVKIEESIRSGE